LIIVAARPLAASASASLAGNAACAGNPKPALSESPSTTTLTGRSAPLAPAAGSSAHNNTNSSQAAKCWTRAGFLPYERGGEE